MITNIVSVIIVIFIALYIVEHIQLISSNVKLWISTNRFGLLSFILLITHFIYNRPTALAGWSSASYALNYKLGFGSRFFIGSILELFNKDFLDKETAYNFCCICILIIIILFSILVNRVVIKTEYNVVVIYLIAMYLCSPGSLASLWSEENMGRLETYNYLLIIMAVLLFSSKLKTDTKYWGLMIISVCNMAIYQGYIFLYYPLLFIMCICDCLWYKERKRWILFGISVMVTLLSFGIFQFGTSVNFINVEKMITYLEHHTNLPVFSDALYYEYFAPVSEAFKGITEPMVLGTDLREKTFITLCTLAPLVILAILVIENTIKRVNLKHMFIKPYIYWVGGYIAFLPQFILNVDWWRWMAAVICYTFFAIICMYYTKFDEINSLFIVLKNIINKHSFAAVTILIYLAMLDKFSGIAYNIQINYIMTRVAQSVKNWL